MQRAALARATELSQALSLPEFILHALSTAMPNLAPGHKEIREDAADAADTRIHLLYLVAKESTKRKAKDS